MNLEKKETKTGEEDLECLYKNRAKLYRINDNQWKERGVGNIKLMRHKEKKQIRFGMRQEKTLKPIANHVVLEDPQCVLVPMANNDKAYTWFVQDFAEGEAKLEKFAARFRTVDEANDFKAKFEAAQKFNLLAKEGKDDELVWADTVEDIDEVPEDDIDTNKTAEGGED